LVSQKVTRQTTNGNAKFFGLFFQSFHDILINFYLIVSLSQFRFKINFFKITGILAGIMDVPKFSGFLITFEFFRYGVDFLFFPFIRRSDLEYIDRVNATST